MTISRREAISLSSATLAGIALTSEAAKAAAAPVQGRKWWMDEPIRMALILYNDKEPPLDTDKFIQQLVDMNANAVVLPTAGIASYYPTKVPFHFPSPVLPAGRDIVGEIVKKAHARNIYVVSRFEWTVNQSKGVVEAHPDWVQRDAQGQVHLWNETYLMCINGGYMQDQIFKIMGEVLAKYPIDGMFFNQGGQRMAYGPCHCDNCKRLFKAKANRDIPVQPDAQYLAFIADCAAGLNDKIETFVRGKRPDLNFMVGEHADSRNAETHSAPVVSSHAFWVYQASETVNRLRSTSPDKMSFNNDAVFIDGYWRYAHRSAPDGEIRSYQNMANGAGPYLFMNGTFDQHDGNGAKGARPAFQFHKDHEDLYVRQENAARVLLLDEPGAGGRRGGGEERRPSGGNGGFGYNDTDGAGSGGTNDNTAMRGFFRILTEQHIPFALSSDLSWIDTQPGKYDLVISPKSAPAALDKYLRQGGRVLAAGAVKPELDIPPVVKQWGRKETLSSYWRVRDRALLPSLSDTDLVFFYSDYLELEPRGTSALTLVPTSMVNPMEKVGADMVDTAKPGLYVADYGKGKLAYLPWDLGDLYYRASAVYHSAMVGDLVDHLLPNGRQIVTNAHPTVQMTLQRQKHRGRTLVHFVNLSGCTQTAYHPAIPMSGIQVEVAGNFNTARMASLGRDLPLRKSNGTVSFTLPSLDTYDVVVLA